MSYIELLFYVTYMRFKFGNDEEIRNKIGYDPQFTLQYQHPIRSNKKYYRADFVEEATKLVIELDGHEFHEKNQEQAEKDKERERKFVLEGFTILRFTGSQVNRNPTLVLQEIYKVYCSLIFKGEVD